MHGLILIFIILIGGAQKATVEKSKFGIAERDEDAVRNLAERAHRADHIPF